MTQETVIIDLSNWPKEPWLMLFAGPTREGNRRARRSIASAVDAGYDVLWCDGFEETLGNEGLRVPVDLNETTQTVFIRPFRDQVEHHTASGVLTSGHRLRSKRWTRWIWKTVTRRVGLILRPRSIWRVLKPTVTQLANTNRTPVGIVYCDDYSLASAWNTARIWPDVPVAMVFEDLGL